MSSDTNIRSIIKQEYMKCAENPVYFMKRYSKIQHPTRGKILFELYPFQEEVLTDLMLNQYSVVLKSRQLGISTLIAGYSLWLMLFQTDKNVLVIATKQDTAKNLVTKVRVMYDNLPSWLKTTVIEDNKLSLKFKNGSQIKAVSAASDSARSEALSLLVIDEAAFINGIDEIWASAQQTLATGGQAIINSCVVGDTLIFSKDGIQEIKDFSPSENDGGFVVNEYSVFGKDKLRTGNLFKNNGLQSTKKIITKFSELEGTHIHKLWAYKDGKYDWFELKDLSVGDMIAIQYGMDIWGDFTDISDCPYTNSNKYKNRYTFKSITNDLAYLFGLYLSEGSSYKRKNASDGVLSFNLTLTCGDDISGVFDRLGVKYSCHDGLHYTVSSINLMELFEYVGFDLSLKAHEKFIPSKLMKMPREQMIHLLRGLYDGNGCARKDRTGISITSSSQKMINQIQVILINLGILSIKTEKTLEQLNKNDHFKYPFKHNSYILTCSNKQAINFREIVSFNLERKRKICESYDDVNGICTYDYIEDGVSFIKEIFNKTKLTAAEFNRKTGILFNGVLNKKRDYKTTRICRKNCNIVYSMFSHLLESDSKWHRIIANNLIWVDIKEIQDGFAQTYDFSLPNNDDDFWSHSVLYNGILGHQTPNGVGNFYHKKWIEAKLGQNGFHPVFLPWQVHPERDQSWRDKQDQLLGPAMAKQECFTGNVRVMTNMGWIQIADIQVGDLVLTHTGKFQKVIRKYINEKNNLYRVNSSRNHKKDCYVTQNHPIAIQTKTGLKYVEVRDYKKDMIGVFVSSLEQTNDTKVTWNFKPIDATIVKTVYNLEVETDNTYVTEFGLVHNCDGDFLSSGTSVIDGNTIEWYRQTYVTDPIEKRGIEESLWIWDYPADGLSYMIVADVARGDGKDYSAFHVIEIESVTQVAEYRGKLDTKSYGNLLVSLATEYNDALLVVENATIGWAAIQQIIDRGYPNLYYSYRDDGYIDPTVHIPKGYDMKTKADMVPGFSMTSKTRPLVVSKLEMYCRERVPIIKSDRLIEELFVFIWKGNRAEAQSGYNDDLVMSFATGLWVRDTAIKLRQEGILMTKKSLEHIQKSSAVYNPATMTDTKLERGWAHRTAHGIEDLTWLINK